MAPICSRWGGKCRFFFSLNIQNLGIGVSKRVQTCFGTHYGPLRPFLGRAPHRKVCAPKGTPPQKFLPKKMQILGLAGPICACWVQILFGVHRFQKPVNLPLPHSEYPYFEYSIPRTNFMTPRKWVPDPKNSLDCFLL